MKNRFIILAPDTDCGKTYSTAVLLKKAVSANLNAMACKPIQTASADGKSPDLDFILKSAGVSVNPRTYARLVPLAFKTPASAELANRLENNGKPIDFDALVSHVSDLANEYDTFFVESAGGIYSPITQSLTNVDFAKKLNFPAIICIPNRIGAVSMSVMTAKALVMEGIKIEGAVFSQTSAAESHIDRLILHDNVAAFQWLTGVKIIMDIKYKGGL